MKAALSGPRPQLFQVYGKPVVCSHCGGQEFVPYLLGRSLQGQLYLREHYGLECRICSHLEFFANEPTEIQAA